MTINEIPTHPGGDSLGLNGGPRDPLSDSYDPPEAEAHRGESTTAHLRDLMASLTSDTESTLIQKKTARRKVRRVRTGHSVWYLSRNRMIAIENGLVIGLKPMNCVSTALLRRRISNGEGPAKGDVVVVDELLLLDRDGVELISWLDDSGVVLKALVDVKRGR